MQTVLNSESTIYEAMVTMEIIHCYKCEVPFAIPQRLKKHFKDSQQTFYCPNGHDQAYVKSSLQIAEEKAAKEKAALEWRLKYAEETKEYWASQYKEQRKKIISIKGQKTKLMNRIKNGVCPCCNRSFGNLANHIKSKHPELLNQ